MLANSCNTINIQLPHVYSYGNMQYHADLPYQKIVELACQLKIDVQKKEKKIAELDVKVQNLEKDKEEKVGCISAYLAIGYQAMYEK